MKTSFTTTILGFGNNTGIEVPAENIAALDSNKKPPVNVTIGSYSYKSTVGFMNGKSIIPLAKAHREAAGLTAGDKVTVILKLDGGIREVEIPAELGTALKMARLTDTFSQLSYSKRKEFCRQVSDAKSEETRLRRIDKVISALS